MKIIKILNISSNSSEVYSAVSSAAYLSKRDHNVYIAGEKKSYARENAAKNKLNFIDLNIYSQLGFFKFPDCDIIEIYGYDKLNSFFLNKVFSLKTPKILRLTSFPSQDFIEFIKKKIDSISLITASVQSIKDELVFSEINPEKITVLNPILVMTRWESAKQIKPATFLQRPYRIATVYRKKDFETIKFFLTVAREVLKSNQNINFLIVGPKDDKIRDLAREWQISHKVDILGWREDMPEVMAMTHIYVKCDFSPNIPRSLIEAMGSSVVCLVSHVKGISDLVISDYNGVIANTRDVGSYVKNILSLINEPFKMQTISNTAYNYAKANFDAEISVKVDELIYENILMEYK
ncbi:MAG TPA: glycosyltransferase [Elusimicrobiales bacterium]|nr:glycosyltransferase [Elusimicrobiales bacterium]HPO95584.1 glycosyltransferase [Elusimicrobiales bacterium]